MELLHAVCCESGQPAIVRRMIDQEGFQRLLLLAYQWAKTREEFILKQGAPLGPRQIADAHHVGVQDSSRVRLLVVDRIPFPANEELAKAARRSQILTAASRGMAIGHGIIIRADCWQNRELLLHQLVHVAQCERSGGLELFIQEYLYDRRDASFSAGALEGEARRLAREICAADAATKQA